MQCDAFEARLQLLLDRRQAPERDPALLAHATCCTECHAVLHAQRLLFQGLELGDVPDPGSDFTMCVLNRTQVRATRDRRLSVHLPLALLALATSLLLIALPHFTHRQPRPETPTSQAKPDTSDSANPQDQLATADRTHTSGSSSWEDLLTLYPEKTRRRHLQQMDRLTNDLRPITQSFTTAAAALRRTILVGKHRRKKNQPQAQLLTPTRDSQYS